MSERLAAAIEELEEHLAQQQAEVADTKKMINSLRKRMNLEPLYTDVSVEGIGSIRPDQYYGKPLATAASDFLERRKRACSAEDILRGLIDGGFDFDAIEWKEKDRLRLLASSLAKNNVKFHRLPQGQFGLLDWYDSSAITKRVPKERKQNGSVDDAETAATEAASAEEGEKASA
jgi:hypothetical protein